MTRFRPIKCFLLSLFYERQTDKPARPIGWLSSCERKYCLLCREKVSCKNFEPFWRNITSKIVMSWKPLPKFRQITWFCYLCFYGRQADKPARPIGWLGSGERKYCLLGAAKVLWKNFEPFLEKCIIYDSLLMHVLVYILLWTTVCCYRCFHERQSYKRAWPIGWLGSNERK